MATVVLVERDHDIDFHCDDLGEALEIAKCEALAQIWDEVLVLDNGRVVFEGHEYEKTRGA